MAAASTGGPRFVPGDRVKVVDLRKAGHVRTPDYVLGHEGEVVQYCGSFLNPEDLSVGRTDGAVVPLYRVKFGMAALWGEPQHHPGDILCIEIYEHWLAPVRDEGR